MRRILVVLLALVLCGAVVMLARTWIEERPRPRTAATPPPPPKATKSVLVAATALDVGTFIEPGNVRWQEWPDVGLPDSYIRRDHGSLDDLVGAVVRQPLAAGEPVTAGKIVKANERGFLAAVLAPGMRAISIPVDETSSNAGLVYPGDRVDLILTQDLRPRGGEKFVRHVSETVLRNLRVIAMGRHLSPAPGAGSGKGMAGPRIHTATLEVTPRDAERVALVVRLGKLSLSLRSLGHADSGGGATKKVERSVTWDSDLSHALDAERHTGGPSVIVFRGAADAPSASKQVKP